VTSPEDRGQLAMDRSRSRKGPGGRSGLALLGHHVTY